MHYDTIPCFSRYVEQNYYLRVANNIFATSTTMIYEHFPLLHTAVARSPISKHIRAFAIRKATYQI